MRRQTDSVTVVTGARGSGKSSWIKQYTRGRTGRVLVWSPLEESDKYGASLGIPDRRAPSEFLEAAAVGSAVWAVERPTLDRFDWFCRVAWSVGRCIVVVDELADVAPIGKALGGWGDLVRKGRHRGIEIIAGAQRPAEIDKTVIGNSTRVVCFRLARVTDRRYVADEISVDRSLLDALRPLQFLDSDRLTGSVTRGKLVFS